MSTAMVPRSNFTVEAITKADATDIMEVALRSAKITELNRVANEEVAKIGLHAVGTIASVTLGAGQVRQHLLERGHRSAIYDDAHNKLLQVTGTNLITLANESQKEVLKTAVSYMR